MSVSEEQVWDLSSNNWGEVIARIRAVASEGRYVELMNHQDRYVSNWMVLASTLITDLKVVAQLRLIDTQPGIFGYMSVRITTLAETFQIESERITNRQYWVSEDLKRRLRVGTWVRERQLR